MKLEIEKDRVLEAAKKCSTAKETLKTLFPKVFEKEEEIYKRGSYFVIRNRMLMIPEVVILTIIDPIRAIKVRAIKGEEPQLTGGVALLVDVQTGVPFSKSIYVKNVSHITYDELKKFFPSYPTKSKYNHYDIKKVPRALVQKELTAFLEKSSAETSTVPIGSPCLINLYE